MKRALLVTAGTAVGLGAALSYTPGTAISPSADTAAGQAHVAAAQAPAPAPTPVDPAQSQPELQHESEPITIAGPVVPTKFGDLQVAITLEQGTLTDVTALAFPEADPKSAAISERTIPLLRTETLAAQSAEVATISGATFTTAAWKQSVGEALALAGL
jgi:uncharacterized protein with FMN-binding domain